MEDLGSRWQTPFWIQVRAQVIGTVIGAAILAVAGLGIAGLTGLNVRDALLYVALPGFVVAVLTWVGVAGYRLHRKLLSGQIMGDLVLRRVNERAIDLHELQLRDVIHEAQLAGWRIERGPAKLVFTSPEGDAVDVPQAVTSQERVAAILHSTAPAHFRDSWLPSHIRALVETEIAVKETGKRVDSVEDLETRVSALEESLPIAQGRAALADAASEAAAFGWTVTWGQAATRFEKDGNVATVPYDDINLVKLRSVLREA